MKKLEPEDRHRLRSRWYSHNWARRKRGEEEIGWEDFLAARGLEDCEPEPAGALARPRRGFTMRRKRRTAPAAAAEEAAASVEERLIDHYLAGTDWPQIPLDRKRSAVAALLGAE